MQIHRREYFLRKLLFIGSPLISVFLLDSVVTDPVNSPKLFILGVVSCGVLAAITYGLNKNEIQREATPLVVLILFLIVAISTLFTTKSPLSQALYGVYGRNNGFLAYLFFSFMFLGGLFISSVATHLKVLQGLFIAGLINIVYCGWVIAFGDFLSWNNPYRNILGTFGNPNFIGAFLGMFFSAWLAYLLGPKSSRKFRALSTVVLPLAALEIYLSDAIQGRVLMAAGSSLALFFWIKAKFNNKIIISLFTLAVAVGGAFALAGALQVGPLTSLIYKTSVSLRGQYWLSAWNTGNKHPLTGVGFDGLGDWYRRMRDPHALELPGVNTVINTAHNVPLDIFAFGGWPLLIPYLLLTAFVAWKIVKHSISVTGYDPVFVALVVAWLGYQLQSIISINQIGLGMWGWLLSGAILSYVTQAKNNQTATTPVSATRGRKSSATSNDPISVGMVSGIGMLVGALIAVPPLSSDMGWMTARKSANAAQLEASLIPSYLNPSNSQKYFMSIQVFEQSKLWDFSHKYALEATKFNPDNYDAWKLLSLLKNTTENEKIEALNNMRRLDPLNPELKITQ
jgi:hypothetical protein